MTDFHLHDSVVNGDLHIHENDPTAFEIAWAIIKQNAEQEEEPVDPTPPKATFWQRQKMANQARKNLQQQDLGFFARIKAERDERKRLEEQRVLDWQRQQQDTQMAEDYGHQPDNTNLVDTFYGHDANTKPTMTQTAEENMNQQPNQQPTLFDY